VQPPLDGLVLAVLADGPRPGYAIVEALWARVGGPLDLPTGAVYPALRRLERLGRLSGSWRTVDGRQRRTYALTPAGRHALAVERGDPVAFLRVAAEPA
jgi:PadR family transcriptional regulator, regulatory protein PadR